MLVVEEEEETEAEVWSCGVDKGEATLFTYTLPISSHYSRSYEEQPL